MEGGREREKEARRVIEPERPPLAVPPLAAEESSSYDVLSNEEEESLLDELPAKPLLQGEADKRASHDAELNGSTPIAPSLRSASLSKGPPQLPAMASPQMGRATSEGCVNEVPCTLPHPANAEKKAKKSVNSYYKRQNELLESFKTDNEQIQEFQRSRTRQRLQSSTSVDPAADEERDKERENVALLGQPEEVAEHESVTAASHSAKQGSAVDVNLEIGRDDEGDDVFNRSGKNQQRPKSKAVDRLAFITLCINIILMLAKAVASYTSGSLSIISSLVDSAVDITTGIVIFMTSHAIRKRDPYLYPRGRTRLEPLALIIISVIMGIASLQLIVQSIQRIVTGETEVRFELSSAVIMICTIITKATLVCICKRFKNEPSIAVLAQDHRNDCLSNTVALLCAAFTPHKDGTTYMSEVFGIHFGWKYLDPLGAIAVSVYIALTWFGTGKEQLTMLSGRSAKPEFINRIIKVCIDHDPRIEHIDTVYVYHFGTRFLVEVHIVLDENMTLKVAHDISESLQINIESLPEVERAFVHTDYEYEHQPHDEHKVV